ncbi:MAG TPA: DUF4124 domain-containing protein [Dyella sp.]|uniref:DUF4124 domain-containing protein n=1 Tax=Dyella sp. TaxID=1869338 RepID=UPI002F95334A
MYKFATALLTAGLLLGIGTAACAQSNAQGKGLYRYRWHDGQGLPHYSDSLTAEAMKYGYDLVNDRGIVVQHVERQLTPEERAAAQKVAAQQAAVKRAADEQVRNDDQMLAAYPTEAAYQASLKQNLDTIDQQINTTQINLHSQEKALTDLLARAGEAERAKQPVPKSLNDSIARQRNVVAGQRDVLLKQQETRDAAETKMTEQMAHYRQVKAAADKDRGE